MTVRTRHSLYIIVNAKVKSLIFIVEIILMICENKTLHKTEKVK